MKKIKRIILVIACAVVSNQLSAQEGFDDDFSANAGKKEPLSNAEFIIRAATHGCHGGRTKCTMNDLEVIQRINAMPIDSIKYCKEGILMSFRGRRNFFGRKKHVPLYTRKIEAKLQNVYEKKGGDKDYTEIQKLNDRIIELKRQQAVLSEINKNQDDMNDALNKKISELTREITELRSENVGENKTVPVQAKRRKQGKEKTQKQPPAKNPGPFTITK